MKESVVGIHVDSRFITAAQVSPAHGSRLRIRKLGWVKPDAPVTDESLARAIRELWRSFGFTTTTVSACLRTRSGILRYFEYPYLTDNQLASALELEAEEALLASHDKICLDWHVNAKVPGSAGSEQSGSVEGLLAAAPAKEVNQELAVLQAARLFPIRLELTSTAVANLYLQLEDISPDENAVCLLHLTPHQADIVIIFEGNRIYPRCLFSRSGNWESSISYLMDSVQENIRYFRFKLRKGEISKFIVTGKIPGQDKIIQELEQRFGLPVHSWNPLSSARMIQSRLISRSEDMGPILTPCLGLALGA
jgi:Tfp pilus assembly PilM family ATPase